MKPWFNTSRLYLGLIITGMLAVTVQSCEKKGKNETKISSYKSDESHNNGQNCMNCHKSGGDGEGWFTVAGSVYDSTGTNAYANATVKIFSGPNGNGTLLDIIEVDKLGNFYTTEAIDLSKGAHPIVESSKGINMMSDLLVSGQCNSCHGVTTGKIWAR